VFWGRGRGVKGRGDVNSGRGCWPGQDLETLGTAAEGSIETAKMWGQVVCVCVC